MPSPAPLSTALLRLSLASTALLAAGCVLFRPSTPPAPPSASPAATPAAAPLPVAEAAEGAFDDDAHAQTDNERTLAAAGLDPAKLAAAESKFLADVIDPLSPPAVAQEAAQALGTVLLTVHPTSSATLAALAPLLTDPNRVDYARLALDRAPGPAVDKLFLKALPEATGRTRLALLDSIGSRRIVEAADALEGLLNDSDPQTALAATRALGRIGGPEALVALIKAPSPLAPAILNARLAAAAKAEPAINVRVSREIYENPAAPLAQRSAALRRLIDADPAGALELINTVLSATEPAFHAVAIESVRSLPQPDASAFLGAHLAGYRPAVQIPLIAALGHRADAGATNGLFQALNSSEESVRLSTLEALGRLPGNAEIVPKLARVATGKGEEAKVAAASLARLSGMGMDDLVAHGAAATAGDDTLRSVYIQALAARNQTATIPFLLGLRDSPSEALRLEALDALRAIAGAREENALIAWAVAAQKTEQTRAVRALITIILRDGDVATRPAAVIAALENGDSAARLALLPILSRVAGPTALAAAGKLALEADEIVATAAAAELTRWPDATALPVLVDLAGRATKDTLRDTAVKGATRHLNDRTATTTTLRSTQARALLALPLDSAAKVAVLNALCLCADQAALDTARSYLADPATAAAAQDAVDAILSNLAGVPIFTASNNGQTAKNAGDGRLKTYWMTNIVPGEWLQADLHHPRPIRKIILEQSNREWDFPASIDLFVTDDPAQPGAVRAQAEGTRYRTEVNLPAGTRGRYLLIRQTGTRSGPWAVAELIVE